MELRHLITFRTIVDTGGFKKSAEKLGYAQSSITGHIRELEEELGKPLFDRLGRNIALTQAGRSFLPYALDIIKLYSQSKDVINAIDEPSGPLIIGASESVMIYWLPNIIIDFMEKYPKVELIVKSLHYANLSSQLKNGEIDIAILVELPNWNRHDLSINKIKDERISLIQSTKKVNTNNTKRMLVTEYLCSWRPVIDEYIKMAGTESVLSVELPSVEAIKKYVLCGLGESLTPNLVVKEELANEALEEKKLNISSNTLGIYSAVHKNKWISTNLDVFLNLINEKSL